MHQSAFEDTIQIRKFIKTLQSETVEEAWKKWSVSLKNCRMDVIPRKVQENAGVASDQSSVCTGRDGSAFEEPPTQEVTDGILDFYFTVRDFLNISELVDENYVVYTAFGEDGRFYMKLFCVNPAGNLQKCLDKGISTVFFSRLCCRSNITAGC